MPKIQKHKAQQPEALAELAQTAREGIPGDGDRSLKADSHDKPVPTDNALKHDVAETLLSAGAHGNQIDPHEAHVDQLPDRTRSRNHT
jgi:hypothetical protein